ncbi:T9SS type A sorting domain-containing protein [Chitinophagaceae bacterium MMS25-I14]
MRNSLLLLGITAISLPAFAQQKAGTYDKSVFRNAPLSKTSVYKPVAGEKKAVADRLPGWNVNQASAAVRDVFGPAIAVPGSSVADKAQYCADNYFSVLGLDKNDWKKGVAVNAPHASYIDFSQSFGGHTVVYAKVGLRFTADGQLVRIMSKSYGVPAAGLVPQIFGQVALEAATADISGAVIDSKSITGDWVWFPVPSGNGYELRPAWQFSITGTAADKSPLQLTGYTDAVNGAVLYRVNEVKEDLNHTVKGTVYKNGTLNPATNEALPNLKVVIGGNAYYTDSAGNIITTAVSTPTSGAPVYAVDSLLGTWSKVRSSNSGNITPSFKDTITANNATFVFPATGTSSSRHVNAYYHVNRVHDFMKRYYPTSTGFTGMDLQLPTNIDVTSGACNAYYATGSINFYAAGSGCNSFAEIGDIIYHEYGHGISDKFYRWKTSTASTIQNSALNEANSDIWAISITHNPILGQYCYTGDTSSYIRRYDINPKVYPQDIQGEPHADGEIIAGAWWDVAVNLGSIDSMTALFTKTYYDTPDGPDGTEGEVYHEVLMSALTNDDNDNNLSNGTPHFSQIVAAFAKHGIYLLSDAVLTHQEVANQPSNTAVQINASLAVSYPVFFQKLVLNYRLRGNTSWDTVTMVDNGSMNFSAQIPAQNAGAIMDYFFRVDDMLSNPDAYFPAGYNPVQTSNEVTLTYQYGVGLTAVDSNDFEGAVTGWQIGNISTDNATKGIWIQAVPVQSSVPGATGALVCQTGSDHTSGSGQCLVTGNAPTTGSAITTNAVVQGTTTVLTPVFDLSGYRQPVIEFYRWYSNDRGNNPRKDQWQAAIHDSQSAFWKSVDQTYQSDYNWRRRIFTVKDYLPTSTMVQMRFVASDATNATLPNQGRSVVEAAVDDFRIYDKEAPAGVGSVQLAAGSVSVYPNPADENLRVVLSQKNITGTISLCDITGKAISVLQAVPGTTEYQINTAKLAAGTYMLMVRADKTIQVKKVVIAH